MREFIQLLEIPAVRAEPNRRSKAISQIRGEGEDVRAGLGELAEEFERRRIGLKHRLAVRLAIKEEHRLSAMAVHLGARARDGRLVFIGNRRNGRGGQGK
jgi:hypothetical protein